MQVREPRHQHLERRVDAAQTELNQRIASELHRLEHPAERVVVQLCHQPLLKRKREGVGGRGLAQLHACPDGHSCFFYPALHPSGRSVHPCIIFTSPALAQLSLPRSVPFPPSSSTLYRSSPPHPPPPSLPCLFPYPLSLLTFPFNATQARSMRCARVTLSPAHLSPPHPSSPAHRLEVFHTLVEREAP